MLAYLNRAESLLLLPRPSWPLSYGLLSSSLGFFPSLFLLLSPLFLLRGNLVILFEEVDHNLSLAPLITINGHIRSDGINSFGYRSVPILEKKIPPKMSPLNAECEPSPPRFRQRFEEMRRPIGEPPRKG